MGIHEADEEWHRNFLMPMHREGIIMESFSQRKGLKPIKRIMQVDSMDDDLRNVLWNALTIHYWNLARNMSYSGCYYHISKLDKFQILVWRLWSSYFKKPFDKLGNDWRNILKQLRNYFYNCSWSEVYDFIEFVGNNFPDKVTNKNFIDSCNVVLKQELSAYRFVGGKITQITSEEEIVAIEDALKDALKPVNIHLKSALDLLADRKSPDYRNSIKESISAVESICKLISGNTKVELGQALQEIEKKTTLHSALKKAFNSLYGYTSNTQGIRHALGLLDEPNLDFEDAKFMLVSCSAFVNYLITKASKAGIKL